MEGRWGRMSAAVAVIGALVLVGVAGPGRAAAPPKIFYQGQVLNADGSPREGTIVLQIRIWDAPASGILLYEEAHLNVPLRSGVFGVPLGSGFVSPSGQFTALDEDLFAGTERYVEVVIDGEVLSPRQQIGSVGYAFQSSVSERAGVCSFADVAGDADTVDGRHAGELDQAAGLAGIQNRLDQLEALLEYCGDGTLDPGEACDAGAANSDTTPDACRTSCRAPGCGDGVLDTGEQCEPPGAPVCEGGGACQIDCFCPSCDADGDGALSAQCGGADCDDENPEVFPGAPEICDGVDNNCNDLIDEGNPGGGGPCSTGLPGVCGSGTLHCDPVSATFVCIQDVQASPEVCDGLDNDCNGAVDEGNFCDDGLPCTEDGCDGASCIFAIADGTCLIGGTCYADLQSNPATPCEVCAPMVDQENWTLAPDGTECGVGGVCTAGVCQVP